MPGDRIRLARVPWWQGLLLALAVVAVVALVGLLVVRAGPAAAPPQRPLVVFVGDSYTAGTGASDPAASWVARVARAEGWRSRDLALGGTGFVATSSGPGCDRPVCPAFSGVLDAVARARPAIVVVSGGRNDTTRDPAEVQRAIVAFFPALRSAVGSARIVTTSPLWDVSSPPSGLDRIATEAATATAAADGDYLRLGQPLEGRPELLASDGLHPNDRGHAAIAKAFIAALRKVA